MALSERGGNLSRLQLTELLVTSLHVQVYLTQWDRDHCYYPCQVMLAVRRNYNNAGSVHVWCIAVESERSYLAVVDSCSIYLISIYDLCLGHLDPLPAI